VVGAPLVGLIGFLLLLLFLPLRLVLEANPEWRLVYWVNALQVLGLSGCLLYRLSGWQWVRYFAPPLLFALVAVPWPMGMEKSVIQGLMRLVAGLTVEVAGCLGIPAVQHGNLIEVSAGMVGIDEACSGVRSLQSGLMLSLFLGEMHRFSVVWRLLLLGASLVFVLVANLARTSFLVWAAANRGMAQMEAWHNSAGVLVMLVVLPGLLAMAYLMRPGTAKLEPASAPQPVVFPLVPRWVGVLALVWLATAAFAVEAWYRLHEANLVANPRWTIAWPTQIHGFQRTSVPENSLAILRCSQSAAGFWEDDEGNQLSAFLLRWAPGKNSAQLAKGHRPDTCFPAAGAKLVEDFGKKAFVVRDFEVAFRHQTFETGDALVHVFYCLWPDRISRTEKALREDGSRGSRLQAVAAGKRNLGQQVLEIVLSVRILGTMLQPLWQRRFPRSFKSREPGELFSMQDGKIVTTRPPVSAPFFFRLPNLLLPRLVCRQEAGRNSAERCPNVCSNRRWSTVTLFTFRHCGPAERQSGC